ncbi:MAG: beta strand repeat-containing protein, partial [Candidatus Kapaibacterium sp.]
MLLFRFCAIVACILLPLTVTAQLRDLHAGRLVLDDDGNDGGFHRLIISSGDLPTNAYLGIPTPLDSSSGYFLISNPSGIGGQQMSGPFSLDELRLISSGTSFYNSFISPTGMTSNIIYTLPLSPAPTATVADGLLQLDSATGQLSWVDPGTVVSANAWSLSGNTGTTAGTNFIGTTDNVPLHIRVNNVDRMIFNTNGSIQVDSSGNARGAYAVDMQSNRDTATQVASAPWSVVGGGGWNTATGINSTIGGGLSNTTSGVLSTVGGGQVNTASGLISTVGGGSLNIASGDFAAIAGGANNRAAGAYSAIAGGNGLTLDSSASGSFGYLGGGTIVTPNYMTISAPEVAVFGNTDLWLANNDTAASQLRFYESNTVTGAFPGTTNYTSFEAGDQSADITYTLPLTTTPSSIVANGLLQLDSATGQLSWVDPGTVVSANAWSLSGNTGTTAGTNFIGTTDNVPLHIRVNNVDRMIFNTNGSIQVDSSGNARGAYAVDMQSNRDTATQVASAPWSVVGGGGWNTATGINSTIGGGLSNTTSGVLSTVGGGQVNTASGLISTVGGGSLNIASGDFAAIAGGANNRAAGAYSAIAGGNGLTLDSSASGSFGYLGGGTIVTPNYMTISAPEVAVFGNTDLWLANNDTAASQLRFYESNTVTGAFPGTTNYTSFEAGDQSEDITYTLPLSTTPSSTVTDGLLQLDSATGQLGWVDPASVVRAAGWSLSGNAGTIAGTNFLGTTDATALRLYVNSGTNNSLILNTNGSVQRDAGGNARGSNAVDMQRVRALGTQVASGQEGVIGGGASNIAAGAHSTVGGGHNNTASVGDATIGGGGNNVASGNVATVGGG